MNYEIFEIGRNAEMGFKKELGISHIKEGRKRIVIDTINYDDYASNAYATRIRIFLKKEGKTNYIMVIPENENIQKTLEIAEAKYGAAKSLCVISSRKDILIPEKIQERLAQIKISNSTQKFQPENLQPESAVVIFQQDNLPKVITTLIALEKKNIDGFHLKNFWKYINVNAEGIITELYQGEMFGLEVIQNIEMKIVHRPRVDSTLTSMLSDEIIEGMLQERLTKEEISLEGLSEILSDPNSYHSIEIECVIDGEKKVFYGEKENFKIVKKEISSWGLKTTYHWMKFCQKRFLLKSFS